jgi:hypothetical protein
MMIMMVVTVGAGIVDDNVERSQACLKNAKPGEVCAL